MGETSRLFPSAPASTATKIIIVWATSAAEPTVILIRNL